MSYLAVEIESLILDGFRMDPARGRRLARLTETALERLLRQRGLVLPAGPLEVKEIQTSRIHQPAAADEGKLAEELALALCRALDRVR